MTRRFMTEIPQGCEEVTFRGPRNQGGKEESSRGTTQAHLTGGGGAACVQPLSDSPHRRLRSGARERERRQRAGGRRQRQRWQRVLLHRRRPWPLGILRPLRSTSTDCSPGTIRCRCGEVRRCCGAVQTI